MSIADNQQPSWYTRDGDTDYLYQVLRHEPMELGLNDRVALGYVLVSYLRAAFFGVLAGLIGLFVGYAVNGVKGAGVLGLICAIAVFLLVYLRSKVNEPLGEWKVLLSDRARSSDFAYTTIKGVIDQRQLPLEVKARRMIGDARTKAVANRLIITQGTYTAYVAVFPYGTSLYLSWRMWRRRSGFQLLKRFISDFLIAIFGSTDIIGVMQRTDPPRAMREAVHSACREGLKVAVNATMVPVQFGFPEGLPHVEGYKVDSESHNIPMPVPPAVATVPQAITTTQYAAPQPAQSQQVADQPGLPGQDDGPIQGV